MTEEEREALAEWMRLHTYRPSAAEAYRMPLSGHEPIWFTITSGREGGRNA